MLSYLFSYKRFALAGILAGILLIQACGRALPPQESCNFVQNQGLQRVSWPKSQTINLYIDASVPPSYHAAIFAAVHHWNALGVERFGSPFFTLKVDSVGSPSPQREGYSKIYLLNTWEENKKDEQARTTIYWSGGRIYEADIRINALNFNFFTNQNAPSSGEVHLESLMVHEFGHVLGLSHTDQVESVMYNTLAAGQVRDLVSDMDLSSLSCEYSNN